MAKQQLAAVPQETLPAELMDELNDSTGRGVSTAQDDNLVPLVYILQKNSPQTEKRDQKYLNGAEAGDIWLRNNSIEVIKGAEGIIFQPCYFAIDWVEWVPRDKGGGFVTRHRELPPDAREQVDPQNPNKVRYLRPNGNEIIQTRNHIGRVINAGPNPMPYVIPMFSSGHTISREWMMKMNNQRTPDGKSKLDSWKKLYQLTTRMRSNQYGSWFTWAIAEVPGYPGKEDLIRGKQLHEAFAAGEKEVEAPVQQHETQDEMPF